MEKVKKCSICGGLPKFVYYNIPKGCGADDSFEEDENGDYLSIVLLKRIECCNCGATVAELTFTCDDAISYWNTFQDGHRILLQRAGEEICSNIEMDGGADNAAD